MIPIIKITGVLTLQLGHLITIKKNSCLRAVVHGFENCLCLGIKC